MSDILRVLRRRWPIALVLLVLLFGLCFGTVQAVPPHYESKSAIALIPPENPETPNGNRFLLLGGLTPGRDVLLRRLSSEVTRKDIVAGTDHGDYTVEADFTTSAPIVLITATGPTPAVASTVLERMLTQLPKTLRALQDDLGTVATSRIVSLTVSQDTTAHRVGKNQIRAVVAVGGVGLVAALLGLVGLDGVLARRRLRRKEKVEAGSEASSAAELTRVTEAPADTEVLGDADAPDVDQDDWSRDRESDVAQPAARVVRSAKDIREARQARAQKSSKQAATTRSPRGRRRARVR